MKPQIPGTCVMPVSCPQQSSGFMPRTIPGPYPVMVQYWFHAGFMPVSCRVPYLWFHDPDHTRFHAGFMPRTIHGFILMVSCRFHGVHQKLAVSCP
eukprot:1898573-Heterocapsa_arctica.AAC.1